MMLGSQPQTLIRRLVIRDPYSWVRAILEGLAPSITCPAFNELGFLYRRWAFALLYLHHAPGALKNENL